MPVGSARDAAKAHAESQYELFHARRIDLEDAAGDDLVELEGRTAEISGNKKHGGAV
ncbi:hypothetical protein [Candidatus Desulfovibrio trichonymphae]|uniref:hypothetical protein n=1 Tax=Candidatus Desulfovibrio trichonymphae TaxID=1725232 RepID=UPI0015528A4F|nr:hypothetical protein [Candidatus Desulfovibrio trichonymphae]GHU92095.1 hypothetical protein AGMMS49925_09420 [Deltaproteobacteria bacterium]GHU99853.1 hypothetical protein AGMMS50248_08610 [Deltaproteobacteria bacterium]